VEYRRGEAIFTQGDRCEHVLYIQKGNVKLSVFSKSGRELSWRCWVVPTENLVRHRRDAECDSRVTNPGKPSIELTEWSSRSAPRASMVQNN
jgi:hypothetical protein